MHRINYGVSLDICETASQFSLSIKQGDTCRRLVIALTVNGQIYKITDDCHAIFASTKPDGTIVLNDCLIEDNTIIYDITSQNTASVGIADCEIVLYGGDGEVLTSPRFKLEVYDTVYSEEKVETTDEYKSLISVIAEANELFEGLGKKIEEETMVAFKGEKGDPGVSISKIEKTASVELIDTYTITLSNGSAHTFTVKNGADGKNPTYIKEFSKSDFTQVGTAQRYVLSIKKSEHGLEKPYVDKVLVNRSIDDEEETNFQTAVSVGEKTLSTGTIKIYITIDLSKYTEYSGKIYLKGE